jgi:hypothetical protein
MINLFGADGPCCAVPCLLWADGAPVVPISAQLKYNVDVVCEFIEKRIPVPVRDFVSPPQMIVIRSACDGGEVLDGEGRGGVFGEWWRGGRCLPGGWSEGGMGVRRKVNPSGGSHDAAVCRLAVRFILQSLSFSPSTAQPPCAYTANDKVTSDKWRGNGCRWALDH